MMLLHDRVKVEIYVVTGERDGFGNPIASWVDHGQVPAEVHPLGTEEIVTSGRDAVVSRYRVTLAPQVHIGSSIGEDLRLTWRDFGPGTGNEIGNYLKVDGTVERHMMRGRLHHYELVTKSVNG